MACVICKASINFDHRTEYVKLYQKGCSGINKANKERGLDTPDLVFDQEHDIYAHKLCRSKHTNPISIKTAKKPAPAQTTKATRSSDQDNFNFKTHCLFCGVFIELSRTQKRPTKASYKYSNVQTLGFQHSIIAKCNSRKDHWALQIHSRLVSVNDLPAEEALYHHTCKELFMSGKSPPKHISDDHNIPIKRRKIGRPQSEPKADALRHVIAYLEDNDDETITLQDLHQVMLAESCLSEDEVYTPKQLKRELEKHYGARVSITTIRQRPNIVTLTSNLNSIIQEAHEHATVLTDLCDIDTLVKTVGKYIRTDIKSMDRHGDKYPTSQDMSSIDDNAAYLPHSLRLLLSSIIKSKNSKLRVASIGQSIMQSTCPRSFLPPLQVGLSVTLEHKYGYRDLVDMISTLGFCSSYSEANKYRTNAAVVQGVDLPEDVTTSFLQYQADNVDHALRTLDGYGSIHVMGQMATCTPAIKSVRTIPRLNVDFEAIKNLAKVSIVNQKDPRDVLSKIAYSKVDVFHHDICNDSIDIMWTVAFHLPQPQPMWSGFMQMVHTTLPHPGKCSDIFLPMIDLTPSDPTCVRSTLEYVVDHARRYNTTPVITFDQQLWWIAYMVIESQPRESPLHQVVLILGGFHTQMSFMGSIGSLMAGSGLKEVMTQVYAEGSVEFMLSGKAMARAVRAHLLVDAALNTIATSEMLRIPVPRVYREMVSSQNEMEESCDLSEDENDEADGHEDDDSAVFKSNQPGQGYDILTAMDHLVKQVSENTITLDVASSFAPVSQLRTASTTWRESLNEHRTAKLWLMYMELVGILRAFIRAGRTGDWILYLQTLHQMLPFLAASGHHNYTKSLVLYLDKMNNLEETHPNVYSRFVDGLFVLRRSDGYWAGIYSDLYIEQVLMKNVKSVGGLTRGRGFEQSTSLLWLLSTPACAEISKSITSLTSGDPLDESEADNCIHKDRSLARLTRDSKDLQTILNYFQERKPFSRTSKELRSLSSGLIADKSVNTDNADLVGQSIVTSMIGKTVAEFKFCKKEQVRTLASSTYIHVEGERLEIDPKQLFQRLVVAGTGMIDTMTLFSYELSSYPTALFDTTLLMRLADKASFQTGLVKKVSSCIEDHVPEHVHYVLDGGSLLQKLPWPSRTTYADLASLYVQYVTRHYGNAVVVFDGYDSGPSTKDETHQRREGGHNCGAEIKFKSNMQVTMKKKAFLANAKNKQKFLHFIGKEMEKNGIRVHHSSGDADYDIVTAACAKALKDSVVLVGDDTDILVLLLYHWTSRHHVVFLQTSTKVINIRTLQNGLEPELAKTLLFIHAVTGCDTVSRPYGIGKIAALGKFRQLQEHAKQFLKPNQLQEDVAVHGLSALETLYVCGRGNNLDFERASRFSSKVASRSMYLPPECLPPTTDAATQHSYRVYHQVQTWIGNELDPTKWGWQLHKGQIVARLKPVRMTKDAAPACLLKLVKCNCHGKCDRNTCSCRKNGLLCTLACGHCKGLTCSNAPVNTELTDD